VDGLEAAVGEGFGDVAEGGGRVFQFRRQFLEEEIEEREFFVRAGEGLPVEGGFGFGAPVFGGVSEFFEPAFAEGGGSHAGNGSRSAAGNHDIYLSPNRSLARVNSLG